MNNLMKIMNRDISNVCVIADIHSSPLELKSIIKQARERGIDKFISLGDLWDRGYDPNTTVDIIYDLTKEEKLVTILGNHCWKYVRYFNNMKVNISEEQQNTLNLLSKSSIDKFLHIFQDNPVAIYDPVKRIFLSHAAGGRPDSILFQDYKKSILNVFSTFNEYLFDIKDKFIDKKHVSNLLYGITNGQVTTEGRPVRLPITKDVFDNLEGWKYIYGHHHLNCFYPERGNTNSICLDYCSGENPNGKLAALIIPSSGEISQSNLIFSLSSC